MLMIIGRLIALLILIGAAMALGAELLKSLEAGQWEILPMGVLWFQLDAPSLNLAQALVQRYLHPAIWDPAIIAILQLPAWFVLAAIAGLVYLIFRRRPERKRFASRELD